MSSFAAVMTGKGTGAISTIQVFGDNSEQIIKEIFKPAHKNYAEFKTGTILLGKIFVGEKTIDEVIIGCEEKDVFAINCHGNPLIVEKIMTLLAEKEVKIIPAEQLIAKMLSAKKNINTIEIEAKLAQAKAKTIAGTRLVLNQISGGLNKIAQNWLAKTNTASIDDIKAEAEKILQMSDVAKLIIFGCKVAIAGPPNSGKSTLLNCLTGRQKAIVTDIKGTTRDWVSGYCQIEPLSLELFDTAGLDEKLVSEPDSIESLSQQKTAEVVQQADIVLFVLDNSQTINQLNNDIVEKFADKKIVTVLNKSDLPPKLDAAKLPQFLTNIVQISAKYAEGIESLREKIIQTLRVDDFDLNEPVCITGRQQELLRKLCKTTSPKSAGSIITELLNSDVYV